MISEQQSHKFCKDDITKIENYDKAIADTTQIWHIHHRLELTLDGEFAHSRDDLKRLGMYFSRPYFELIFLTNAEHQRLHQNGRTLSVEIRQKISNAMKGKTGYWKGKTGYWKGKTGYWKGKTRSIETKLKISKAKKVSSN